MPRKRFSQLCVRSTTQRRAFCRARRLAARASPGFLGTCAVNPNSCTIAWGSA